MRYLTQISSIIVAFVFVYSLNFKSLITIDYFINQVEITELFCINKDKPQLKCNGKCHLTQELKEVETKNTGAPFAQNVNEFNIELIFDFKEVKELTTPSKTVKNNWINYSESIINREHIVHTPPPKG
jgi:hypothetical protein